MLIRVPYFVASCCTLKTAENACSGRVYILNFIILTREFFQTNQPNFISKMLWGFSGNLIYIWNTHDTRYLLPKMYVCKNLHFQAQSKERMCREFAQTTESNFISKMLSVFRKHDGNYNNGTPSNC